MYREEAHYLERTAPWVERVGLTSIKERLLNDEAERTALNERFKLSQKYAQVDPWKARAEGEASHEFTPLKLAG
jgi:nitrite reductase (NADH) large subunit